MHSDLFPHFLLCLEAFWHVLYVFFYSDGERSFIFERVSLHGPVIHNVLGDLRPSPDGDFLRRGKPHTKMCNMMTVVSIF